MNQVIKLLLALTLMFILCSCSQDEEKAYSCDESINQWVKMNLSEIQTMNRSNWNNLDEIHKIPVYRAFTKNQRIQFWEAKLDELRSLDWSDEELKHIEEAFNFLFSHPDLLEGDLLTDEQSDELHRYCYLWIQKGISEFGWTKETALSIIATGNTVSDTNGSIVMKGGIPGGSMPEIEPICNCHLDNILFTLCPLGFEWCEKTQCATLDNGCGLFLIEDCNGKCMP
ncbi:bacteriocin fulvocin C-related protein [Pseudobutyrivibrio sp.]